MTAIDYIEEIKLRLSRFDVIKHLNDLLILSYINKGRQQAQRFTVEAMPERYGRISILPISPTFVANYTTTSYAGKVTRMYPVNLPNDFINVYRVILKYQTVLETEENEIITLTELGYTVPVEDQGSTYTVISGEVRYPGGGGTAYTVGQSFTPTAPDWFIFSFGSGNDSIQKVGGGTVLSSIREVEVRSYNHEELYHSNILSINPPMIFSPIYLVMANNDFNYQLLIAGLDITSNTSIFADENYTNVFCEVWYTTAITELEYRTAGNTTDNELTLPVPLEELVINYAMLHSLRHVNHQAGIELLIKEIRLLESLITQNYDLNIQTKDIELATY